jgi:hypothetical protein
MAVAGVFALVFPGSPVLRSATAQSTVSRPRNIVIFVADGLRHRSVTPADAPTMYRIETEGVSFVNSHSVFPTFTTANASAIATGHYLGDTGDYSNTIFVGYPTFATHDFGRQAGTVTPFIESNPVLGDLDSHFDGNYLNELTLLAAARIQGFQTAAIGKVGPSAIQDVSQLNPKAGQFTVPSTIIIDDSTGTPDGVPLSDEVSSALKSAGLPTATPKRLQPAGDNVTPGTTVSNEHQQSYFADVATKAVLPLLKGAFKNSGKPFVLLYWSRDPDGSQHNEGDSLNKLVPGINGPTSRLGVRDADNNFKQIFDYIGADSALASNTDIFITSDHGFATVSRHEIDAQLHPTTSYASKFTYRDTAGHQEVAAGFLPSGFLAIDLAHFLGLPLYDPDTQVTGPDGKEIYEPVDPTIPQQTATKRQHPANSNGLIGGGDGLIGGSGQIPDGNGVQTDAEVVVAANGGSDLIYLPKHDPETAKKIVAFLAGQDYVGAIFASSRYGEIPGALPLSDIRLLGSSKVPAPSVVVSFKTFAADPRNPLMTAIQVSDTTLQEGQGMHGGFGRDSTYNFMAAFGPDFKKHFVDKAPVGNTDIAPTLAHILHLDLGSNGLWKGRVLRESLVGGPAAAAQERKVAVSAPSTTGKRTVLLYQRSGNRVYFDRACFIGQPNPRPGALKHKNSDVVCPSF